MSPVLQKAVLDGASRHRLSKGFLLLGKSGHGVDEQLQRKVSSAANNALSGDRVLRDFVVKMDAQNPSLVTVVTPFHQVYTVKQRNIFMQKLARVISLLNEVTTNAQCQLVASGVNPLSTSDVEEHALCADIHAIEVFDDGEIERIYNLFRQYMPELLAISTNSPIFHGQLQKDASARMRDHPQSFLPRYLSQFTATRIEQIKRMMRKEYNLSDLRFMDINPLNQEEKILSPKNTTFLDPLPPSIELRFIDAQCSTSFIRAQLIIFQAIAIYGRTLARRGQRLPAMKDELIDENKALAYKDGATAILKPEIRPDRDSKTKGYSYHDKGKPEVATTALLMDIEGRLIPALRNLECQPWELFPILLGAELRRNGKSCLANYAELQQYLYYTQKQQFSTLFPSLALELLSNPTADILCDFNRQSHLEQTKEFELKWSEKLAPPASKQAMKPVQPPSAAAKKTVQKEKDTSDKRQSQATKKPALQPEATAPSKAASQSASSVQNKKSDAVPATTPTPKREKGSITRYKNAQGQITGESGVVYTFVEESIAEKKKLYINDRVSFEAQDTSTGPWAIKIHLRARPQGEGLVKYYDAERCYGFVTDTNGTDLPFHGSDIEAPPVVGQAVKFETVPAGKELRAVFLRFKDEGPPVQPEPVVQKREYGIVTKSDTRQGRITSETGMILEFTYEHLLEKKKVYINDQVTFEYQQTSNGVRAINIHVQPRRQGRGYVKYFDTVNFYGFVTNSDGTDIAFHGSDIETPAPLNIGQMVSFEIVPAGNSLRAVALR